MIAVVLCAVLLALAVWTVRHVEAQVMVERLLAKQARDQALQARYLAQVRSAPTAVVVAKLGTTDQPKAGSLWAGLSVNHPIFKAGQTKDLRIEFTLVNDGDKVIDPKIADSRIVINRKERTDSDDVRHSGHFPLGLVLLPVSVPMNGVVDPIIEPRLLHDVDLGAIPPLVTDLPDAGVIEPESRPVTGLLLEFDPSDVVAECVFELAPCADTSVDVTVAFLEGSHHQMSVPVQGHGFSHPPGVTPLPIRGRFPFGLIEGRAVELVMLNELPLFPIGRCGESVFVVGLLSNCC